MKTQQQIFAPCSTQNSSHGWPSKAAVAMIVGLVACACTTDQPSEKKVSVASPRINLTPLLTLAVAEMERDVDTARECSIDKRVVVACIFV